MISSDFLVPFAAAVVAFPRRSLRRSTRMPHGIDDATPVAEHRRALRNPALLVLIPFTTWFVAGPMMAAAVGGFVVVVRSQVRVWNQRLAARRIVNQLPSILHDVARRIRSGYPAPLAFAEILGPPTGSAGGTFAASMLTRGEPLLDAVVRWRSDVARLVGPTVLDDLVHVVALSERIGGLRASAVEVLADLASERHALEQESKAQASQAKASATVMTIAPLVFSAQLVLRDPAASHLLLHTTLGWALLGVGVSFDAAAWLWIRRATSGRVVRVRSPARIAFERHGVGQLAHGAVRWLLVGTVDPADRVVRRVDGVNSVVEGVTEAVEPSPLERLGIAVERTFVALVDGFAPILPTRTPRIETSTPIAPWSTDTRRRLGLGLLVLPPLILLRPVLGALAVATLAVGPTLQRRIVHRRSQRERAGAVGQTIELLRLALECGSSPALSLIGVAEVGAAPLRPALRSAADALRQGAPFDEVMRRLADDAPELRAMADVLLASSRLGLPVVETLRGLAVEARASRRRDAEARSRRLPVVLLFPVVCLTLPAFVLLTVAPLLLSGLGALHL